MVAAILNQEKFCFAFVLLFRRGFRTKKLKIREKFIVKPRRLIDHTFVETKNDIVVTLKAGYPAKQGNRWLVKYLFSFY